MSREQWGHGYYSGLNAQKKNLPKYCITYADDGHIEYIFIVQELCGDTYILEAIDLMWFICHGFAEPSKYPIDHDKIYEKKASELNRPKWVYSWSSVVQEFKSDEKLYEKEESN